MTKFSLPAQAIQALDNVRVTDPRKFVFDQPVYRGERRATWQPTTTSFVAVARPISKRTAKHDKLAVRAFKYDGIKPFKAPDYAVRNAGLVGTIH